jgi:hypothetical protein
LAARTPVPVSAILAVPSCSSAHCPSSRPCLSSPIRSLDSAILVVGLVSFDSAVPRAVTSAHVARSTQALDTWSLFRRGQFCTTCPTSLHT